jgi:hypothetical protein
VSLVRIVCETYINFTRLRLDYIGKSSGAGALSIWTHNLKDIQFIKNYKSTKYDGPAFKAGAGVQGFEILEAARDHDVTVLAGICEVGFVKAYKILGLLTFKCRQLDGVAAMSPEVATHLSHPYTVWLLTKFSPMRLSPLMDAS